MNWNQTRFANHMRFHQELTDIVENRANEIIKRLGKRGWVKEYDEWNVTMAYNNSCHCHPQDAEFTFPADWIFAEDWEAKVDAIVAKEKAEKDATARRNQAIKEEQEKKELARLQSKYTGATAN